MAEKHFSEAIDALFKGMDQFVSTKTVVGDAVKIGDAIILPLVDVTCGMAAGSFQKQAKESGGGGMNAKITPSAILIIQNGVTKLVNVKNQDAMSKAVSYTHLDRRLDYEGKRSIGSCVRIFRSRQGNADESPA